jgi:predicted acylesterase/phospholipase RssA
MQNTPPPFAQPPLIDIAKMQSLVATILSSVKASESGYQEIALDELRSELKQLRHSDAVIEWCIYNGIQNTYFVEAEISRMVRRQLTKHSIEVRPTLEKTNGLRATEKFWNDWRSGKLVEAVSYTLPKESTLLVMSGGGYRATMFHLGVLLYLAKKKSIKDITGIVSVSGGSITAAHFVKRWNVATKDGSGFNEVASELIQFMRSDLRNRVFVSWLWSILLPRNWSSITRLKNWYHQRTAHLLDGYRKFFQNTTIGDLELEGNPRLAIIATDSIRQERVAFTSDRILRLPMTKDSSSEVRFPNSIASTGVPLYLAVTASSCFPPVFNRLKLRHTDLGLNYSEFKDDLYLNDGGVSGNLGIKALMGLQSLGDMAARRVIVCDAERPLNEMPGDTILADANAQAAALSQSERDDFNVFFKEHGKYFRFSDRLPSDLGVSFRLQTVLSGYRTDLDRPSERELYAIILHGYLSAAFCMTPQEQFKLEGEVGSASVKELIAFGHSSQVANAPTEEELAGCGVRKYGILWFHGIVISIFAILLIAIMTLLARTIVTTLFY